jgi:GT2 family glycosyltransferase
MGECYESRVGIQIIASRPDYLVTLAASLKEQTYRKWDLVIVYQDMGVITPLLRKLLIRLQREGHRVKLLHAKQHYGLGELRNLAKKHDNCEYGLRIDDDSLCEPDYIERLYSVIKERGGVVGGVVPPIEGKVFAPPKEYYNRISSEGDVEDDCIYFYNMEREVFPADHIRSSFMYKNSEALDFPTYNDDFAGFREETDFCVRMKHAGYPIWFVPKAVCWHFQAESGGTRPNWIKVGVNGAKKADERFRKKVKEYADKVQDDNGKRGRGKT